MKFYLTYKIYQDPRGRKAKKVTEVFNTKLDAYRFMTRMSLRLSECNIVEK